MSSVDSNRVSSMGTVKKPSKTIRQNVCCIGRVEKITSGSYWQVSLVVLVWAWQT